jgi:hypothetical protein
MTGYPLTSDEIHTARLLRSEGKTIEQIARRLKRSREAVSDACVGLDRLVFNEVRPTVVPARVLAERDARLSLSHRDVTAAIAGDPLPGRSALDRKRMRVAAMRSSFQCLQPST